MREQSALLILLLVRLHTNCPWTSMDACCWTTADDAIWYGRFMCTGADEITSLI